MLKGIYERLPKTKAASLALALLGVVALEIVMTCLIPSWRSSFYTILQLKDQAAFPTALMYFTGLMLGLGAAQGLKTWVGQLLSFTIREAATKLLFKTWVKGRRVAANYTQAMTESLRNATELYLEIAVEIAISASIVIALIIANLNQPTILVAALIYTLLASAIAVLFNKPLITTDIKWQQAEGEYRESISAIANGKEDFSSKKKLVDIVTAYYMYIKVVMYFTLFTRVKASLSSLVPYFLLAGAYFSGALTLGDFMAGVATFELIVINATILLVLYPKLTKARASYKISKSFYREIQND